MAAPLYPSLYQVNTRVWLTALSRALGRRAILDDIPDSALDDFANRGLDWIWMLSVWQTGPAAQGVSRSNAEWRNEFERTLPDLTDEDIAGSGFAVTSYSIHRDLGGDAALARLRERLRSRGLKLMLDFVPNHVGLDHPWVSEHPDYLVTGSEIDLARAPRDYFRVQTTSGSRVFAHGRDPYFPGWPDTIQLNYGNPDLQEAMIGELLRISGQCDGLRCDMAMLILPEIFWRTWSIESQPFWPRAISRVRENLPDFVFLAEVYWELEWTLQQQGFDYCYDKRLYDRLREGDTRSVRNHLSAHLDFQNRLARFLENHDESRAAVTFEAAKHRAAATLTYFSPGLRFFHQGQFEGCRQRISPHLVRGPLEPADAALAKFYSRLLTALRHPPARNGTWQLVQCSPASEGNWTNDCFIAYFWEYAPAEGLAVAVNFSDHQSQARLRLPFATPEDEIHCFKDLLDDTSYERKGSELTTNGLYVDLPAWGVHIFSVSVSR